MAKAKISLEFTYKTRDGQEIQDLQFNPNDTVYPFAAYVDGQRKTYTARGYYYPDGYICRYDLIKQSVKKTKEVVTEAKKEVMKSAEVSEAKPHIHHDMIVAWAKNPKLEVQFKSKFAPYIWIGDSSPTWDIDYDYRFKPEEPKFLTIIGADGKARTYPEPCRDALKENEKYYLPDLFDIENHHVADTIWRGYSYDISWLNNGLVHLTEEAAELHAKAMLGID